MLNIVGGVLFIFAVLGGVGLSLALSVLALDAVVSRMDGHRHRPRHRLIG